MGRGCKVLLEYHSWGFWGVLFLALNTRDREDTIQWRIEALLTAVLTPSGPCYLPGI